MMAGLCYMASGGQGLAQEHAYVYALSMCVRVVHSTLYLFVQRRIYIMPCSLFL